MTVLLQYVSYLNDQADARDQAVEKRVAAKAVVSRMCTFKNNLDGFVVYLNEVKTSGNLNDLPSSLKSTLLEASNVISATDESLGNIVGFQELVDGVSL